MQELNRPVGIKLIALFQFSKAGFLLVLLLVLAIYPSALSGAGSTVRLLISLATNHIVTAESNLAGKSWGVTVLFPLYAVICMVFGFGLWFLQRWARVALMWACSIYLIRYAQALLFRDWVLGKPTVLAESTFTAFALVDAIILMHLYMAKDAFSSAMKQG